jgi:hypothetical protein
MNREKAVRHAIHEMELAGLEFTADEMEMWDKIASGELPRKKFEPSNTKT